MPTATELAQTAQDQILDSVHRSQEAVVEAVRLWAKGAEKIAPAIPPVPFAEELPKPEELVAGAFDFAQKLLAAQREFALAVLAAAAPAFEPKARGEQQAGS